MHVRIGTIQSNGLDGTFLLYTLVPRQLAEKILMSKNKSTDQSSKDVSHDKCIRKKTVPANQKSQDAITSQSIAEKPAVYYQLGMKMLVLALFCVVLRICFTFSSPDRAKNESDETHTGLLVGNSENDVIYESEHSVFQSLQSQSITDFGEALQLMPTVFVGVLVRNKAHTLPYFLHGLEIQTYPTDRVQIHFIIDNSIDESLDILQSWNSTVGARYHTVQITHNSDESIKEAKMWSNQHYSHVVRLRQELLTRARMSWADFYLSIDADVIIVNPDTLGRLVHVSLTPSEYSSDLEDNLLPVVSPLFNCTSSESYANFWGAMSEDGYYLRSDTYFDIQRRRALGVFSVAMVHTVFLVNLRHANTQRLVYSPPPEGYTGPLDDLIIFARSAQRAGVQFYIENSEFYGFISNPVEEGDLDLTEDVITPWLSRDQELFEHLRLQAAIDLDDDWPIRPSVYLRRYARSQLPTKSKLGFNEVYCINLDRRPDRRAKMEYMFEQLGIDAKFISGVDGKLLTQDEINRLGIFQLEGYADPYHKRSLKFGEIGCFLSHYYLWQVSVHTCLFEIRHRAYSLAPI